MAEIKRYVNPASSAGGDGTTNGTAGANRAYVSLSDWEAAEQTNLVTDGDFHVVECVAGTDTDAKFTLNGWTTGAGNDITIKAEAGSEHLGVPGDGFKLELSHQFSDMAVIKDNYVTIQDIEFVQTNTTTNGSNALFQDNNTNCVFERLIFECGSTSTSKAGLRLGRSQDIESCFAHDCGTNGFLSVNFNAGTFNNCTAVNCDKGFYRNGTGGSSPTVNNCVAYNNTTADFDDDTTVAWAGNYNASSDSTEPTGNAITTDIVSGDFVDAAGGDFTAKSGGTLDGAGSATYSPTLDVASNSFATPPSVGAYEVVGGGGVTVTPGAGSLTLASYAPTVTATDNHTIETPAGSLSITGYAPTVVVSNNIIIEVPAGSLTLTSYAPTVAVTLSVAPDAGSLTLTGYAPAVALTANHARAPPVGSLTLTGYAPTVTTGAGETVTPDAGALALTGYAPTLVQTANHIAQPGTGTLTLTGYVPSTAPLGAVLPEAGSLTLTGYAPTLTLTTNNLVQPGTGTLTFTGYVPTVVHTTNFFVYPNVGILTITGYAPSTDVPEVWDVQANNGTAWTEQGNSSDVWTEQPNSSDAWDIE